FLESVLGVKEDYQRAVELAQEGNYKEARRFLIAHDHPKTNALLDKVNKAILADGINQPKVKQKKKSETHPLVKIFRAIVVSFFIVCGGLYVWAGFLPPLPAEGETTNLNSNNNRDSDSIISTQAPLVPSTPLDNVTVNPLNPQTVYAAIGARTRDCPNINCNPIQVYQSEELTLLGVAQGELLEGSSVWYQVSRSGEIFFIHEYSITFRGPTPIVPTVDWRVEEQPVYYGNNDNNSSSSGNTNTNSPSNTGSTRRPANCDEAVAMGLSPQEAAQWDHLDGDNDGVACYGD